MSAIDELSVNTTDIYTVWPEDRPKLARVAISAFFWGWFFTHQNNKVLTISLFKGLIRYPIRVSHLKPLFIQLFGEPIQT